MKARYLLIVGLGAGYVLGARAGRERYEQLRDKAQELWESPRVTRRREEAIAYAKQQAPVIRDKAAAAAKAAPAVISDSVKTVASVASDAAESTVGVARTAAHKTTETAKDAVEKTAGTARNVVSTVTTAARDVAGKLTGASGGVKSKAAELRSRGDAVGERAVLLAGETRDNALADIGDAEPRE